MKNMQMNILQQKAASEAHQQRTEEVIVVIQKDPEKVKDPIEALVLKIHLQNGKIRLKPTISDQITNHKIKEEKVTAKTQQKSDH